MESIFINYRRADNAAGYSRSLAQALRKEFGDDQVFRDIKDIPPGGDFPTVIANQLASCTVMLVLIGTQWARLSDSNGQRRLDNPQDWVRREIVTALTRDILVIPVLICGAPMPATAELPHDLVELASRNAFVMSDDDWEHDLAQLVVALREHLNLPLAVATTGSDTGKMFETLAGAMRQFPHAVTRLKRPNLLLRMFSGLMGWVRTAIIIAIIVWIGYTQSDKFAAGVDRFFARSAEMLSRLLQ